MICAAHVALRMLIRRKWNGIGVEWARKRDTEQKESELWLVMGGSIMKTNIHFSRGSTRPDPRQFLLGRCLTVRLLLAVTFTILPQESFGKTIGKTIAVEGWNSEGGGDRNRFFVTAHFIDPATEEYTYPGALNPDKTYYSNVEQMVYNSTINAIQANQTVNLLGYSHGAVAVLNVLKRLDSEGVSLANVSVVTVDEVIGVKIGIVWAKYPLKNPAKSVPAGVGRALNIYQRQERSSRGERVRGALNIDASQVLVNELTAGRSIDQEDTLFWPDYGSYHIYIQGSLAVRRRILEEFGVSYLGGIWQFDHTNGCGSAVSAPYVLHHSFGGAFQARRYVLFDYDVFWGNVTDTGILLQMTGDFSLLAYAPDCPDLGYAWITGWLEGLAAADGRSLGMDLLEEVPVYYVDDVGNCEWAGYELCDGAVQGTVLYALPSSTSSSPASAISVIPNMPKSDNVPMEECLRLRPAN